MQMYGKLEGFPLNGAMFTPACRALGAVGPLIPCCCGTSSALGSQQDGGFY